VGQEADVGAQESLKKFFLDLTNRSLGQLGIGSGREADYLAEVLADFGVGRPWLPRHGDEARRFVRMANMTAVQLGYAGGDADTAFLIERAFRKHVGDFTLFMSGVFRRFIERNGLLDSYFEAGSRSYAHLSRIDEALSRDDFKTFEELSRGFERYSGAIDYMRKCFFAHAPGDKPFADFVEYLRNRTIISPN
jgi:hypothetical protein